jgi:hypothetical protein
MTEEEIEKLARAMCEADGVDPDAAALDALGLEIREKGQ